MKRTITPFGNGLVRLRLIGEDDLETTLSWRNRDEVRIWFKTSSLLSLEQHRTWYQRYAEKDDDFLFIVEFNGKPIGQASVYGINWESGSAEIGRFLVAPGEEGKGYISQACGELVRYCFDSFGLSYLFLEVMESNEKAIRAYLRNGFTEETRYDGLIRMNRSLNHANNKRGYDA